ncbi:transposase [Acidobacteriota bacterium]
MPRATRVFHPGYIWHITQRCHKREFLLKFVRDKKRFLIWLFEAKKRFRLSILNYSLTSNHIHLLVSDNDNPNAISKAIQLVSGRTAQEYNSRKNRSGAYWEDRYHVTAIDRGHYLIQCMIYIDLNMVRAGIVEHPSDWPYCGYTEISGNKERYNLINFEKLCEIFEIPSREKLRCFYTQMIENALITHDMKRNIVWSESIAVGNEKFVNQFESKFFKKSKMKEFIEENGLYILKEDAKPYSSNLPPKKGPLRE